MRRTALAAVALLAVAGCGDDGGGNEGAELDVAATTTIAADMTRAVGGTRTDVHGLLRPGGDPHDYEPRPSDVREVAQADVVIRSGGEVDEWLDDVLDKAGGQAKEVTLLEGAGPGDPHWWQDPRAAEAAVGALAVALARSDPAGEAGYRERAGRYRTRLRRLDRDIAACVRRLPSEQRRLVTTHDSLGRFARRYGLEVIGTVIPGRSTEAQPSARDVDRLVRRIEEERVQAVFPESALNPKLERTVAREAEVTVGGRLYADALGPEGSEGETYPEAMAFNTHALVEGMSGGKVDCTPRA
jgi:ABC-type Zn uptake system ZnuABC Zn-binding protein ZnuA